MGWIMLTVGQHVINGVVEGVGSPPCESGRTRQGQAAYVLPAEVVHLIDGQRVILARVW
jgi:hypothetical protein